MTQNEETNANETTETTERYEMFAEPGEIQVRDNLRAEVVRIFAGPDRLLAATAECERLNAMHASGISDPVGFIASIIEPTPASFLTKTLPEHARRQRLTAHLTEVMQITESLFRVLAEDAANLKRATALLEKLEKELSGPLSEPESVQNGSGVGADTPRRIRVLGGHAAGSEGVLLRVVTRQGGISRIVRLDGEDFERSYAAALIQIKDESESRPERLQATQRAQSKPGPY